MLTYNKAIALTSVLAIVLIAGAFWLIWYFLPLLLQAPFLSTLVILLVAAVVLALLIRVASQHKQREEQVLRLNATREREREAQQITALQQEVAREREAAQKARRETAQATAQVSHESKARREAEARLAEEGHLRETLETRLEEWQLDWPRPGSEENKALVRRFIKEFEKGDLNVIDKVLAPDFVDHELLPDQEPDREIYKRSLSENRAAFSDLHITIEDQIAEGDKVMTRYRWSGTHDRGKYMGMAPTGKRIESLAIVIFRISGGIIKESWGMHHTVVDINRLEVSSTPEETAERSSPPMAVGIL